MAIHSSAIVETDLPESVEVGPFTVIGENVQIGPNSSIGSHCLLGLNEKELIVGRDARIRSHSVIYGGSNYGDGLETGHSVHLREGVIAGRNLRVGTLSDLQGDTKIGDFNRFHSNVHIGKYSTIGSFTWIFPYCVLTNDPHPPSEDGLVGPTVEDFALITTHCTILPGVRVGRASMVGAGSVVVRDVPEGTLVLGNPATVLKDLSNLHGRNGESLYPWTKRFKVGYPPHITEKW